MVVITQGLDFVASATAFRGHICLAANASCIVCHCRARASACLGPPMSKSFIARCWVILSFSLHGALTLITWQPGSRKSYPGRSVTTSSGQVGMCTSFMACLPIRSRHPEQRQHSHVHLLQQPALQWLSTATPCSQMRCSEQNQGSLVVVAHPWACRDVSND